MSENILCAVPARGGSKRIPRKNVADIGGKPMIAHTIEAARKADIVDTVHVCTEDEEIAAVAEDYGATVPVQIPDELCGDRIPSHEPCQYLASYLEREQDETYDTLLCLQPSSPLRTTEDITAGVEAFRRGTYEFLVSVTHVDPHYFHWVVQPGDDDYWELFFGERYMKERGELPDVYRPNGSIKIADLGRLEEVGHFFGEALGTIKTPPERSIHVGTPYEFRLAGCFLTEQSS